MSQRHGSRPLAVVLILGACASSSTSKVYEDSDLAKTTYSSFLVVGVASNNKRIAGALGLRIR